MRPTSYLRSAYRTCVPFSVRLRIGELRYKSLIPLKFYLKFLLRGFRADLPLWTRIEVSAICNLGCRHCPTGQRHLQTTAGARRKGLMSEAVFDRIVDQLKKIPSVQTACFYLGGEPLLNPRLPEMLRRIKAETTVSETRFNTNGMLLDAHVCDQLLKSNVDLIRISIDGRSPEENDAIRVGSNYERIRENVQRLIKAAEGTSTLINIVNVVIPGEHEIDHLPPPTEFLRRDFGDRFVQTHLAVKWPGLDEDALDSEGMQISKDGAVRFGLCMLPFRDLAFRWNGDIAMCCYDIADGMALGNVMEQELTDIWNGRDFHTARKALASWGLVGMLPPVCQICPKITRELLTTTH